MPTPATINDIVAARPSSRRSTVNPRSRTQTKRSVGTGPSVTRPSWEHTQTSVAAGTTAATTNARRPKRAPRPISAAPRIAKVASRTIIDGPRPVAVGWSGRICRDQPDVRASAQHCARVGVENEAFSDTRKVFVADVELLHRRTPAVIGSARPVALAAGEYRRF